MFGPKTAIFAQKYAFLGTYRPCRLILMWCPFGRWLWRAGFISKDTYLLYIFEFFKCRCSPLYLLWQPFSWSSYQALCCTRPTWSSPPASLRCRPPQLQTTEGKERNTNSELGSWQQRLGDSLQQAASKKVQLSCFFKHLSFPDCCRSLHGDCLCPLLLSHLLPSLL